MAETFGEGEVNMLINLLEKKMPAPAAMMKIACQMR